MRLKVGTIYVETDRICIWDMASANVLRGYCPGQSEPDVRFVGDDAKAMLRWLDANYIDVAKWQPDQDDNRPPW